MSTGNRSFEQDMEEQRGRIRWFPLPLDSSTRLTHKEQPLWTFTCGFPPCSSWGWRCSA